MKTKIILLIGAVALVTLSFTFSQVRTPMTNVTNGPQNVSKASGTEPVGGFVVDEVVK